MFQTEYGSFNGTTWENLFQIILKKKYMNVGYQKIVASPGDYGLEGFTRDGIAFQCYCPEVNLPNSELYAAQRDKITTDINKLHSNSDELAKILGGTKIKCWTFLTPRMGNNDILKHCQKKVALVKSWGLPIVDENFDILVHEIEDYAGDVTDYFATTGKKIPLTPEANATDDSKIVSWKSKEIDLVKNVYEKSLIRVSATGRETKIEHKANALTDKAIKDLLNGESILRKWQNTQPENYQRFMELLVTAEEELKEKCILNELNPNDFVETVSKYMEGKIKEAFEYLEESTIMRLKSYSVSSWLIRCPLYFEVVNDD